MHQSQQIAKVMNKKMWENETLKRKTPNTWLKLKENVRRRREKRLEKAGKILSQIFSNKREAE
jgi:hypothetical protein